MHAALLALIVFAASVASSGQTSAADAESALREFSARVDAYVALHQLLETNTPPLAVTDDPAQIIAASDALAAAVVAARPNAKQGDLFTTAAARIIRGRIVMALRGVELEQYLLDLYEGNTFRQLRAAVHARDTRGTAAVGVPLQLLWVLPELPSELGYRIIGRDLALWDWHAAMVIDFVPNAFPELSLAEEP